MNWNKTDKAPHPYKPIVIQRSDYSMYIEIFDPGSKFPPDAIGWLYVVEEVK